MAADKAKTSIFKACLSLFISFTGVAIVIVILVFIGYKAQNSAQTGPQMPGAQSYSYHSAENHLVHVQNISRDYQVVEEGCPNLTNEDYTLGLVHTLLEDLVHRAETLEADLDGVTSVMTLTVPGPNVSSDFEQQAILIGHLPKQVYADLSQKDMRPFLASPQSSSPLTLCSTGRILEMPLVMDQSSVSKALVQQITLGGGIFIFDPEYLTSSLSGLEPLDASTLIPIKPEKDDSVDQPY